MAQTLKFGNKTWATKVGSTLAYNDENGNYKPLPFTFTRSTSATRVNKEGLIEVVTNDRPRIDYTDTSDGVLLLEKAATNLITYSEDFSQSIWTKSNSSITSNSVISPDGTLNASTLTDNTVNGIHRLRDSISLSASTNYSLSVFAKKGTLSNIQLALINTLNSSTSSRVFDLENGALGESLISGGTLSNSKITDYGNGWFKCEITSQLNSTPNTYQITLATKSCGNATTVSQVTYDGDGSGNVYLYGAMIEQNSFASSYIPTQGSAVTRVAETASGAGNSEVFNDSEGVLFADIAANQETNSANARINIHNGSATEMVRLGYTTSQNQIIAVIVANGGVQAAPSTIVSNITLYNKCAIKYKANDFALWVNGFEVGTDSSGTTPSGLNELSFEKHDGVEDFYGKTKEIGYYNTALTDLELETLTSYRSWESMVNELNLNIIYNG